MNGRLFMEAMGDIKDDFVMEASDIDEIKRCFAEWDDEEVSITESEKTENKKIKRIPRIRKLLIAAVISVSLLLTANFVAMALGYDSLAILKEFGNRIIEMFEGERVEYKGISIIKEGESISYTTINELFEQTNFDIMYPSKLSNNLENVNITVFGSYDAQLNYTSEYNRIIFLSLDLNKQVIVDMNPNGQKQFLTNPHLNIELINGHNCYIDTLENGYEATFIHKNYIYTISAPNYDDIVTIVSNMKEYEE